MLHSNRRAKQASVDASAITIKPDVPGGSVEATAPAHQNVIVVRERRNFVGDTTGNNCDEDSRCHPLSMEPAGNYERVELN